MIDDWSEIKHFVKSEFACKCGCGYNNVSFELVKKLDFARTIAGVPFAIVSGCRCEAHNKKVGGVDNSAHLFGLAVDIKAEDSVFRFRILSSLLGVGLLRLGVYSSFLHADIDASKPQNLVWLSK